MPPKKSLQPGQTSADVKQLQDFLISQGMSIPAGATGYYGTQTTAAVKAWQDKNGVDSSSGPGYWGPKSIAAASSIGDNGGRTHADQPFTDAQYNQGVADNPDNQSRIKAGNTPEKLAYAASTGDLSGLINTNGQPFSTEDQQKALAQATADSKLYYDALQSNDTANTQRTLAQKQADYNNFLTGSAANFQKDKTTLDQNAADNGMLFSTGRTQKEQMLAQTYANDQTSKFGQASTDIANTAQNFQYNYGNNAANGLSQYYNLGSNNYNPSVASGGVTSNALSSAYNPNQFNFQGTQNTARLAQVNTRAAGYLANQGNKLLSTGYNNQF